MSTGNPFGRMEGDKVKESTANRDTKTPAGTTGMFHLLKNQNRLCCRSYICGRNSFYVFFFLKFKIGNEVCYFFNGPVATIQH